MTSWIEDGDTLQTARYRGFVWERIADATVAPSVDPSLALWFDRVPVHGWIEDDRLRLSLLNGPSDGE